jgi:hypothetical protein
MKSQSSGKPTSNFNWSNAQIKEEERNKKIESVILDHKNQSDSESPKGEQDQGGLANILNAIDDSQKSAASNMFKTSPNDMIRLPSRPSKINSVDYVKPLFIKSVSIEDSLQKHHSLSSIPRQ